MSIMTMTAQHHQLALAPSQPPTQLTFANRKAAFPQKLWEMLNPPPVEPGQESPIHDNPIRWSDDGTSFYVVDPERLRTDVLGRWFKHANFNSFVRQLNMYGFQKCSPLQQGALVPTATENYVHFSHPLFHRDHPELVKKITRKKAGDKGASAAPLPAVTSPLLGTTLPAITGAEPPAPIGRTPSQYLAIEAQAYEPPEEPEEIATTVGNVAGRNNNEVVEVRQVANGLSAIKRAQATIQADLESLKQSNQDLWREAIVAREKAQKQEHMLQQIVKFLEHQYGRRRSGGTPETVPRDIDRTSSPVPSNPRKRPRLMINDSSDSVGHSGATSDRFQAMDTPGSSIAPASYFSPAPVSPTSTEARTPGPTLSTTESNALTHYIPPTTTSNAEASLQQLLSSPEQYHALMRALAMHNPTAFSAAMPTSSLQPEPAAENELQLSNRWDFSQIGQSIPTGTSTNNNLSSTPVIPDPTSTNVSALAPQLAPYAQQIASTSKLGEKINQVDEMQSSLDEMMALIGVDPSNPFAGNPDTTMDDLNTQAQEDADRGFASMSDPQSNFPTESLNFNPDTDWDTFLKFAMTDPNSFDGNMGTNTNDHILRDGAFLDEVASQHSSDPTTSPAVPPHDLFGSENGDISMESAEPGTTDTTNSKRKTGSSQIGSKASNRQPRLETSPRTPRGKQ